MYNSANHYNFVTIDREGGGMAVNEAWGRRLRAAKRNYEETHDTRLTFGAIGERVGTLLQRKPFSTTAARAWFAEGQEPGEFAVAHAIAAVLEANVCTLVFGADADQVIKPFDPARDSRTGTGTVSGGKADAPSKKHGGGAA